MKKFLLFAGKEKSKNNYQGWYSYQDSFDSAEEAKEYFKKCNFCWGHIVDTELEVIIDYYIGEQPKDESRGI